MIISDENIIKEPNDILRVKCAEVPLPLSDEDRQILEDMLAYVRNSHDEQWCLDNNCRASVGIAAPQIGIAKRMLAVSIEQEEGDIEFALVNPRIIANSTRKAGLENGESCLSVVPDVPGFVPRYYKITVRAYNLLTDQEEIIRLKEYPAVVLQHEIDHLYGILYHDHINRNDPWLIPENTILI